MKFISAALCISMFRSAAAESCPDELPGKVELNGAGLAFHYGILENDQALCGKLVSDTEAWVGFGAQPEGVKMMIGAQSIIALPFANTVQQYMLNAKNTAGIVPTESQTLTETAVNQDDGATVATFKQPLSDNGLTLTSNNVYLLAKGFSNDLGYHVSRGFVSLDFETNVITSPTTANPTTYPSLQPSLKTSSPPSLNSSSPPSMNSSSQPSLKSSSPPSLQPSMKSSSPPSLNSSSRPSSQPTQKATTQTSSKPSSPPSLGSTGAPSSVESTPLVTTNTTTYPSSQPSNSPLSQSSSKPSLKPSTQSSSSPSILPSAEPSILPSTEEVSSLPSSEPQTLGTSTPSSESASPSQLTSTPLSLKPSANPSRFLTENSQPVPIIEDKDPTSSSPRKVFSMGMALSTVACALLATASW